MQTVLRVVADKQRERLTCARASKLGEPNSPTLFLVGWLTTSDVEELAQTAATVGWRSVHKGLINVSRGGGHLPEARAGRGGTGGDQR